MEKLMIKAIRDFKQKYPNCDIRSIYVAFWRCFGSACRASFRIDYDYVTESCVKCGTEYFFVSADEV